MRTIEKSKTVVDIIVWPHQRLWPSRYATSCEIGADLCTLILTERVFRDPRRAATAYKRFANRMRDRGLNPPNVIFQPLTSAASRDTFCLLSATQSLFNTACPLGKLRVMDLGIDDRRMLCAIAERSAAVTQTSESAG